MKIYKYTLDGKELWIKLSKRGQLSEIRFNQASIPVSEEEMPKYASVIALALLQYDVEEIHDEETDIITLENAESQWNNPSQGLTSIG